MAKLYVGNLPFQTTEADLKNFFSEAGEVVRATVVIDKFTNRSRGFGFVEFADDAGAQQALTLAAASTRLDAFDMLQIGHVYRDLGFADEAYAWAARAYAAWGRPPEDAVMQVYAQSTLTDDRARVLAQQAEAAMRARNFGEAHTLFEQALSFAPGSVYLQDRLDASQRAVHKYGG